MLTKTAVGTALVLAAVSGALASVTTPVVVPDHTVYNPMGAHVGTVRDSGIRFELDRDWDTRRYY